MSSAIDWMPGRSRVALAVAGGALIAGLLFASRMPLTRAPRAIEPPPIAFETLDPAIARAIAAARDEVRNSPRVGAAWGKLGMVLFAHELRAEANRCFAEAERLDPREPRWPYYQALSLSSGQPAAAIPKMQRAVELCGNSPATPRLRLAELLLGAGKLDDAAQHYRQLAASEPHRTAGELGLARISFAQQQVDAALARARRAAEDEHTAKAARQLLAQIAERSGRQSEAEAELRRASVLPEDTPWPDPFADEIGRLATGKQAGISRADQLLTANRPAEAAVLLRQVIDDYPDSDWAWMLLGRALLMSRNIAGAERALQHAAQLAPESVGTLYHLGLIALAKQDHAAAAEHLEKAARLQPDFAPAHFNLGRCLLLAGDRAGAEIRFRIALRCQPDYPGGHTELAELLAASGREAEAAEHARTALQLNPADQRAGKLLEKLEGR